MGFKTFALVLTFTSFGFLAHAEEKAEQKIDYTVTSEVLQDSMNYQNDFATIGEYIDELADRGGLNPEEKTAIENFIKAQKIELTTKMPQGKVEGTTVKFGAVSLAYQDDGAVKTANTSATQRKFGCGKRPKRLSCLGDT